MIHVLSIRWTILWSSCPLLLLLKKPKLYFLLIFLVIDCWIVSFNLANSICLAWAVAKAYLLSPMMQPELQGLEEARVYSLILWPDWKLIEELLPCMRKICAYLGPPRVCMRPSELRWRIRSWAVSAPVNRVSSRTTHLPHSSEVTLTWSISATFSTVRYLCLCSIEFLADLYFSSLLYEFMYWASNTCQDVNYISLTRQELYHRNWSCDMLFSINRSLWFVYY